MSTPTMNLDNLPEHEEHEVGQMVRFDIEDRAVVELLRDLLVVEHERQTGNSLLPADGSPAGLGNALYAALRRFANHPPEPFSPAARVTCTGPDLDGERYTYAKVGAVWVSPGDTTGREWSDLVVEYDELTVEGS